MITYVFEQYERIEELLEWFRCRKTFFSGIICFSREHNNILMQ